MFQSFALLVLAILGLFLPVVAQHRAESRQKAESSPKTEQACVADWRADKAAHRVKGLTEKVYVAQCRSASATAQAAGPSPSAGSSTTGAASPSSAPPASGAGQFSSAAEAKSRCGSKPIVWVDARSKTYRLGHRGHRTAKAGAYMCEPDAKAEGMHAARK